MLSTVLLPRNPIAMNANPQLTNPVSESAVMKAGYLLKDYKARWRRITEAMDAAGIDNQSDLARRLKVTRAAVSQWANGRNLPDFDRIAALAKMSGYNAEWLWLGQGPKKTERISRDAQELLDAFESMSDEQKRMLLTLARSTRQQ